MIFTDLAAGEAVFVDANTLLYHFTPDPVLGTACSDLLIRVKRQEIEGYTATHVVTEMAHRLMTLEAIKAHGWPAAGIAYPLRAAPPEGQKLTAFRQSIPGRTLFGI